MPTKKPFQCFENYYKSQKVPFVIYADFECFTKPIHTCQPNLKSSYTMKYRKHEPSGFCYYVKCFDDKVYSQDPVIFTKESEDQDVAQIFVETLEENVRRIFNKFKYHKEMIISEDEKKAFKEPTNCHICKCLFEEGDKKVKDHCHFTGKFRGAAHNSCNLAYSKPDFIPVIFHNLAGYDAHLFVKSLGKTEGKIDCIPNNEEKYISFSKKIVIRSFTTKKERTHEDGQCHICKDLLTPEDNENYTVIDEHYKTKKRF